MGKREELESRAIDLYAGGTGIPQISAELGVSENSLRKWKERAGTEWDDARAAFRKGQVASFEDVGKRVARARVITRHLTGDAASQSVMGQILNESVQAMVYDVMGQIQTVITDPDEMEGLIKKINGIALILARTEQAASVNLKREMEIRKQTIEAAVKEVKTKAHDGTFQFDPEAVEYIAGALYGLKI